MGSSQGSGSNGPTAWRRSMGARWTTLKEQLWTPRPLRQKLALGVWLSVVPILLVTSLGARQNARNIVRNHFRQQLIWDAAQASGWLKMVDLQHQRTLTAIAGLTAVSNTRTDDDAKAFNALIDLFPNASYAITRPDGSTTSFSGPLLQPLQKRLARDLIRNNDSSTTAKALKGISSTGPLEAPYATAPCMATSVPIYNKSIPQQSTNGAITSCIAMELLGEKTGINMLLKAASDEDTSLPVLDLDAGKTSGYALMVVMNQGSTIVLGQTDDNAQEEAKLLDPRQNLTSAWAPLIKLANSSTSRTEFTTIAIKGKEYFVGIDRSYPNSNVLMVLDSESAYSPINQLFNLIWIGNIAALIMSSFAVYRICGILSRPIDRAGTALSQINRGEFGDPLPSENSDVGRLFHYVNEASQQLQTYLADAKQHAITDAQLEEARRIQADFLIKDLPSRPSVELAALFKPAFLIGADWYDAIEDDGITFVVVADVCDKGIPSALYMSVFRSLLRLNLIKEWTLGDKDPGAAICLAIKTVNRYMAETHGSTGMFATVFVGGYNTVDRQLHYVVAGHEAPLVLQGEQLQQLSVGGPAVGIFADASFQAYHCNLGPDGLLLAFSDGLPDARDPSGASFGHERISAILSERCSQDWTAQALIDRLQHAVEEHMQSADQFDDLTLLSLKAKD